MLKNPETKYRSFPPVNLPERSWPSQTLTQAPVWCAVDLRDGNQALIDPMDSDRKNRMFDLLIKAGFKEIEIGFPSASQTDYDFTRELIETGKAKDAVLQVLVPARQELIKKTFEALKGAPRAIVHLYNSTSPTQRRVVFQKSEQEIIDLAVQGARWIIDEIKAHPETEWQLEYSPESFTGTELDYAIKITEAVMDVWQPTSQWRAIVNLPATVEMAMPNVYADQIEYFIRHVKGRENLIISLHPHNDRGTGVAAAEMALLAGADRVEGTLFGNGERTGNVDLVTLAMNMYTQGLNPGLDFSNIRAFVEAYEYCNQIAIHPRHPYAGELVFTAFSGSHQDAIRKGLAARGDSPVWDVPYLPIDPADVGRAYEPIIRINSQSGKGGVAFIMEQDHGIVLPRAMQADFSAHIQKITDETKHALGSDQILKAFMDEYVAQESPLKLIDYTEKHEGDRWQASFEIEADGKRQTIMGTGNGLLDAFIQALAAQMGRKVDIKSYSQHAATGGSGARAVAYVETSNGAWDSSFGVGIDTNIAIASMKAVLSSINRGLAQA